MHLIHIVSSGEWGGPERYAFDICRHYQRQGWSVKVLTRDARAVDAPFAMAGIPVCHAPLRQYPDIYSARRLARMFAAIPEGEGVVHVHHYSDALTCLLARRLSGRRDIRLVATRHSAGPARDGVLSRIIYRGVDSYLFVSEFSREKFYERWHRAKAPLDRAKTAITYNSLYPFPGGSAEAVKGPMSAAYRGKLKPGKGLETLIDAFALLKKSKVRLRIMGKGKPDYVDSLRRRAQMAGVADQIDWSRDTDFADTTLARTHFGVLPSSEPEAFGMANLEFMASGKPQISTFTGAQGEVLCAGEDSLEVPAGDVEALAEAILRLANDADLRERLGANALSRYTSLFSWPLFISRLHPHYQPLSQP